MLEELRIRNFAIIDSLELEFSKGFNVITGETGAGKSIIVDAVELLLGDKSDPSMIRAGAEKTVIEGVFAMDARVRPLIYPILKDQDLLGEEGETFVTLTREIRSNGRSSARVNGITVNMESLKEIGNALIDIHGQSEHMTLFRPPNHINLLDRFADLYEIREALYTVVVHLYAVRRDIRSLMEDEAALLRRAEQLKYDIEEIDAAKLKPGEDEELKAERNRLSNSEQLATLAAEVVNLLNGESNESPAVDALQRVAANMDKLLVIDPELSELQELAEGISAQAQELALEMADYVEEIEFDPKRLNQIEERLELINKMRRRYGTSVELVLEYAVKAKTELDNIENSEERLTELRDQEEKLLRQIGELSSNISDVRRKIGDQLSRRVVEELKDLRMERTRFEVALIHTDDPEGCYVGDRRLKFDDTGIDHVEFMMSANPGEPMRPLAKVASGGEAARIMLAIKRVLTQADHTPTLIFDEVDQGIGGRVGSVVGEKLWELAEAHQVLVVTHLPQLAGYADKHFHVKKAVSKDRTATQVIELESDDQRVSELSDMLGATGEGSKQSAMEILNEARAKKAVRPATPTPTAPMQTKLL